MKFVVRLAVVFACLLLPGFGPVPLGGVGGGAVFAGPCDVVTGGCTEAWSIDRAMTNSYHGPLFQLVLASNHSTTLNVGQTTSRAADMTTWSGFCGGVAANCLVGKVYAQVHSGNDLVPAVFPAVHGPDCSTGDAYLCAAAFAIDGATGLPKIHVGYGVNSTSTPAPEYTIANDAAATGFISAAGPFSIMINGANTNASSACCGTFGWFHAWNAGDTIYTDFGTGPSYGIFAGPGGPYGCATSATYCYGGDTEGGAVPQLNFVTTSPIDTIGIQAYDPSTHDISLSVNGSAPVTVTSGGALAVPGSVHLGGGGDLSMPAEIYFREGMVSNVTAFSGSAVAALTANEEAFFSALSFPNPTIP